MVLPLIDFNCQNLRKFIYKLSEHVTAYAEAMADSNRARDAYVDKEQDKFFHRVNHQWADIDALKEWMEQSELRARALELENESLSARLDSMVDKLCFCTWAEVTSQVVGSELSI